MIELAGGTIIIVALITILVGIANCFFGYRIFRILLGIIGFFGGAIAGLAIAQALIAGGTSSGGAPLFLILGALIGGAIGAVLLIFVYFIGVFLLGAAAGMALGYALPLALDASEDVALIAGIVLALIGGVLALILQRAIIIIATAISGAGNIVTGLAFLVVPARTLQRILDSSDPVAGFTALLDRYTWMSILWLVLAVAGMVVQFIWTGKKKPKPAPAAAGAAVGVAAAGAVPQVVVQQYNIPGQAAQPVQQSPSAPPIVIQGQLPAAPPPPVIPSVVQSTPPAPAAFPAPERSHVVPPLPAPEEAVQSFPTPAAAGSKFCPQCGQPVAYGTTFCTNCGFSVAYLWQ